MNTKQIVCCDCGETKPAGAFHWNSRAGKLCEYCKTCGVNRKVKRFLRPPVRRVRWNKPNTSMSILGRD